MYTPTVVAFSGSRRKESLNSRILKIAADAAAAEGAKVTIVNWDDMPLPMFDQDDEAANGLPENAKKFRNLLIANDGFLVAAPEYNSSITPLLKNAIDWASRAEPGDPPLKAFTGKTAALMSASPASLLAPRRARSGAATEAAAPRPRRRRSRRRAPRRARRAVRAAGR